MEQPPQPGAEPESTGNENNDDEHEQLRDDRPRVYVASLSDYNAGILHGEWIDATQEPEDLHEAVQAMLEHSPTRNAEEFAIHDYEHFGHYRPDEYDSLEWISRVARGTVEHGEAFSAWAEHCHHDPEELDKFEDAYLGEWGSLTEYAEELLDDLGCLDISERAPEMIAPYLRVNVAAFARDVELSGALTVVEHSRGVWLFEGRQ
jgi:antirestriction protein